MVGFGGYVALPAYLAARRRKVPIVVHEANARPGVANRLGARLTRNVFTASADVRAARTASPIGIPLRPAIATLDRAALRAAGPGRVRPATGRAGAAGHRRLAGRAVDQPGHRASAGRCFARAGVQVLHIVGPANDDADAGRADRRDGAPYVAVPFVDQMEQAYAAADFVVCRSGAMTCAELSAVGLPAAYVPLPLRGGEQRLNAEPIVRAGGGLLVANERFSAAVGAREPAALPARSRIGWPRWRAAAAGAGARDADVVLARRVLEIARGATEAQD